MTESCHAATDGVSRVLEGFFDALDTVAQVFPELKLEGFFGLGLEGIIELLLEGLLDMMLVVLFDSW